MGTAGGNRTAYTAKFRAAVLRQVQVRYEDFGPTLAAEHPASDDGLEVQDERLRRWMKQAGLWQRRRRRKPYRQRRAGSVVIRTGGMWYDNLSGIPLT